MSKQIYAGMLLPGDVIEFKGGKLTAEVKEVERRPVTIGLRLFMHDQNGTLKDVDYDRNKLVTIQDRS